MRNVKVAVAFTLLALAGCSTTTGSAPPGESSSTVTTTGSPSAPTTLSSSGDAQPTPPPQKTSAAPLESPTEVAAAQVDANTLPDHYKRQAWTSADGRTIQVVGVGGGCRTASAEVTAQSGDQVLITLVTTVSTPPPGRNCTQELRDVPLNVTLDAPLGSRRLVLEARQDRA